jgi:hypothetical protein
LNKNNNAKQPKILAWPRGKNVAITILICCATIWSKSLLKSHKIVFCKTFFCELLWYISTFCYCCAISVSGHEWQFGLVFLYNCQTFWTSFAAKWWLLFVKFRFLFVRRIVAQVWNVQFDEKSMPIGDKWHSRCLTVV